MRPRSVLLSVTLSLLSSPVGLAQNAFDKEIGTDIDKLMKAR